ncbi:uncharacterized protein LOC131637236 [Vicia villosa]|uniref:uncharacterized protein LOC131637236 n=1 Tax=Vicia villosa TaxID=3911 RepID=UPI00273BCCE4|nr:uncharacterized protein LOC131637236 [Vicia villosa]
MRASEKGGCLNAVGSISTAEHVRRMTKELNRPPLMTELVARTRKKKTGAFVDSRTQKAMDDYQALLVQFLTANPKYTPRPGEPLHPDVDFYLWSKVIGGKGPNGCFFGGGNLAGTLRSDDRTLYQRVLDGEGGSRPVTLTDEQRDTVRQLAINEVRREAAEREAALKAQMEAQMRAMRSEHQREMEVMAKRQSDMEAQIRQFMQSFGGNQNMGSSAPTDQENLNEDEFPDPD